MLSHRLSGDMYNSTLISNFRNFCWSVDITPRQIWSLCVRFALRKFRYFHFQSTIHCTWSAAAWVDFQVESKIASCLRKKGKYRKYCSWTENHHEFPQISFTNLLLIFSSSLNTILVILLTIFTLSSMKTKINLNFCRSSLDFFFLFKFSQWESKNFAERNFLSELTKKLVLA